MMVSRGDEIELTIESSAFEGTSVARSEGLVFFVPYGVPGDRVKVKVIRKKKKYAETSILEVIEPSENRIEPRCKYFGLCGGCKVQNMEYGFQLKVKRQQVQDLFERIGGLENCNVAPVLPSPATYYYRNKMEFSFGANRWLTQEEIESGHELQKGFALGLHIPRRFDKILDLEECFLQSESSVTIVNRIRALALKNKWSAFNSRQNSGYLRNLIIRTAKNTEEITVNLITTRFEPDRIQLVSDELTEEIGKIVSFSNTINYSRSPVALAENANHVIGDGTYREKLGDLEFVVGPTCFFQPNPLQAGNLFSVVEEFAQLDPSKDILYDLFCGVGAIGLTLASKVKQVVGIESHPESIQFARRNADLNDITNSSFLVGDALDAMKGDFCEEYGIPTVMVLDPPRAGFHPKLTKKLVAEGPSRIVYSSCNPATQARDLEQLKTEYRVKAIQPVDMFPQTQHIETVVVLERTG